jgi:hypothetical protein
MRAAAAPPSVTEVFVCTSATPRLRAMRPSPPASVAHAAATRETPRGDISDRRSTASGRTCTSTPAWRSTAASSPWSGSTTSAR